MKAPLYKPRLVTFTGVDDWTDPLALVDLAAQYPVEFGVLMIKNPSQTRWPERYPSQRTIERLFGRGLRLSAHICGQYARDILSQGRCGLEPLLQPFTRAQINDRSPAFEAGTLAGWHQEVGFAATPDSMPILQSRDAMGFPSRSLEVTWLFDASGGNGIEPPRWPSAQPDDGFVGYAGGLSAYNVSRVLAQIAQIEHPYWIDMESGVRAGGLVNRFDVNECRRVCQVVFDSTLPNGCADERQTST